MTATAWIALVALAFTGSQAWIARRKLQFDLFAKRYEVWDAFNNAVIDRHVEIIAERRGQVEEDPYAKQQEMARQKQLMLVLFPPDVHRGMSALDEAIQRLRSDIFWATTNKKEPETAEEIQAMIKTRMTAEKEILSSQEKLSRLVHPYLKQYGWWEEHATPRMRSAEAWVEATRRRLHPPTMQEQRKQPD